MPAARFIPFFVGESIAVTVVSPLSGATITTSKPNVTWSFTPGTQASFRVRIWSDAAQVTLAYDSGNVIGGASTHLVPDGVLLSSATYYLVVTIETTDADLGESGVVNFSTLFIPSVGVINVTASPENDDCESDKRAIPASRVEWDQVAPAVTETFQRYSVWRRPRLHPRHPDAGSEVWQRVASIDTVTTTVWRDYCAAAQVVYEYAVTWTAVTNLGDTRTSQRQTSPANNRLQFDRVILHDVSDPSLFVILTPEVIDVAEEQSQSYASVWGRKAPTALIADFQFATFRISLVPDSHRGVIWRDLHALQTRQSRASTLCLRLGYAGERYFTAMDSPLQRSDGVAQYQPKLSLTETFYEEAVA